MVPNNTSSPRTCKTLRVVSRHSLVIDEETKAKKNSQEKSAFSQGYKTFSVEQFQLIPEINQLYKLAPER
jgi:hypothetical protein